MKIIVICLIIISCYLTQITAKCPSAEALFPCRCQNYEISCGGNDYYNLTKVFMSLSGALTADEKHFNRFYFNNTAITELVSNVFYDIVFDIIEITSAYNLTKIHANAFQSTNSYVHIFYLLYTPYGSITDNSNLWNVLNAMTNINVIEIVNTSITAIPSNAFTALNKLHSLDIYKNRNLKSVGDHAFYELNNLTQLVLAYNPIDHISQNVLSFRNNNTIPLKIFLDYMPNLNSNSFENGTFATIRRPFILYLVNEVALKYLDENVFGIVLSGGNQIDLGQTLLECDCRMYWLYTNKDQYENLVKNALCTDGKSVFTERSQYTACIV